MGVFHCHVGRTVIATHCYVNQVEVMGISFASLFWSFLLYIPIIYHSPCIYHIGMQIYSYTPTFRTQLIGGYEDEDFHLVFNR